MFHQDSKQRPERGNSQKLLLGVLAVFVGVIGYLYLFTGLIVQRGGDFGEKPPPVRLKQTIPPRPVNRASDAGSTDNKPVVAGSRLPQPAVTTVNETAKILPSASVVAAPERKDAKSSSNKVAGSSDQKSKSESEKRKPNPAKVALVTPNSTLYRLESADISQRIAEKLVAEMKGAGVAGVERRDVKVDKQMNRLYIGEFSDRQAATAEFEKLKTITNGAFILKSSDKYELYAGSFDNKKRAESAMSSLVASGISAVIKTEKVPVTISRITARISGKAAADRWVARMKKQSVDARAVQVNE